MEAEAIQRESGPDVKCREILLRQPADQDDRGGDKNQDVACGSNARSGHSKN